MNFNNSLINIGVNNTRIVKDGDGPQDSEACCRKQAVSYDCMGLCKNVGSRSLSDEISFTSACEQHKLTIMRCIVGSFPMPDDPKEVKGSTKNFNLQFQTTFILIAAS